MNVIGVVAALATFLSVWFGHVAVRKIESISPTLWVPATVFTLLGLTTGFLSLLSASRPLSTALGIFAVTLLIDALQFSRQQKRVMHGHAPANPNNPRHARLLAEHSSATTLDLLKRDPIGKPVTPEQATKLITNL